MAENLLYELNDYEFMDHLYSKEDQTAEDVEAAQRIEMLLRFIEETREQVRRIALAGLVRNDPDALRKLAALMSPIEITSKTSLAILQ